MIAEDVAGLILAGGESNRMGVEKQTLVYHHHPQIIHLTNLVRDFFSDVYISGKSLYRIDQNIKTIEDHFNFKGPLNGILSALTVIKNKALLVIPIDMPEIDHSAIRQLISKRNPKKHVTCFYNQAIPGPDPLFAIWEPMAESIMRAHILSGNASVIKLISSVSAELVDPVNKNIFSNINTPEDYQLWLKNNSERK